MNIYPAIDLYQGKVVRLKRGDFNQETVYSQDPAAMAVQWERQGARWLHVVDLEGAKTGVLQNLESLKKIRQAVACKIEFGGGLRSEETIRQVLDLRIERVVIGSKALDEKFLRRILELFGSRVAVGLDIRDGKVQMEGWLKEGGQNLETAVQWLNNFPLETLIYTDIHKDGMMEGPNFEGLQMILGQSRARVILSGGIGSLEDVRRAALINHPGFEGVIMGKAIYEHKFSVEDAIQAAMKSGGTKRAGTN